MSTLYDIVSVQISDGRPAFHLDHTWADLHQAEARAAELNRTAARYAELKGDPSPEHRFEVVARVWVVLGELDDELVAGPFESAADAEGYVDGFDDVYAAQVPRMWYEQRNTAIRGGAR